MIAYFGMLAAILAEAGSVSTLIICRSATPLDEALVPVLGFATFVGACVVVRKSRRPAMIAAYRAFVPLPLMLAVFAALRCSLRGLTIIAVSNQTLHHREIAGGLLWSGGIIVIGFIATAPAYLVIAGGFFWRTLHAGKTATARD